MFDIFTKEGFISFLYVLPALVFCIAFHEFSHAYVAYKLGDYTQKIKGRLTLNPISHIDLVGFVCIALFGFGWGKPVKIDDKNFKNKALGMAISALAGPLFNLIIAVLFTVILKILIITGVISNIIDTKAGTILLTMFILAIKFNVVFGIFNLIPIPPFDGSRILSFFLPQKGKDIMYKLEKYSFFLVLILLYTGIGRYMVTPVVNGILVLLNNFVM